ncbi:MAG: hypothetical protein ACRDNZ_08365 [Streptosporangiaceae bacterium]
MPSSRFSRCAMSGGGPAAFSRHVTPEPARAGGPPELEPGPEHRWHRPGPARYGGSYERSA